MTRFQDPVKKALPYHLKYLKRDFPDWKDVPRIVTYIQKYADLRIYEPKPRKKDGKLTLRCVGSVYLSETERLGSMSKHGYALGMSRAVSDALGWVYMFKVRVGMTLDKTPESFQVLAELDYLANRNN